MQPCISVSLISALFFIVANTSALCGSRIEVSQDGKYKSIKEALEKADNGDTILVSKGSYREKLLINKQVSIYGKDRPNIRGDENGSVIIVTVPNVTIAGFNISGTGESLNNEDTGILLENASGSRIQDNVLSDVLFGIYLKNSPDSIVEGNTVTGKDLMMPERGDGIRLWYSSATSIRNNHLIKTRDLVMWWSGNTLIENNIVEDGRYGLHYMYSDNNIFRNNTFRRNLVGGFLMYSKNIRFENNTFIQNQGIASGYGVGFKDLDSVVAKGNRFIDNRVGIYMDNTPTSYDVWNTIQDNNIDFNDIGISLMPSIERNTITGNNFIDNTEQVEVRGGGTLKGNRWFDNGNGNYWSDYQGYDDNKDGIGDYPYVAQSLFEDMMDRDSVLRIFLHSPVTQALDTASKAFPVFRPEPKLTDRYPLILPVKIDAEAGKSSTNLLDLVIYIILVLLPLLLLKTILMSFKRELIDRNN